MKFTLAIISCFSLLFSFSQNQHEAIILDSETKEPLEFVAVFNSKDYTISNADGRFAFSSPKDSIIIYRVGYDKLEKTFNQLPDTIFLNKSVLELNEVVVTNEKTLWQKIRDSLNTNYSLKPFKEKFILRSALRKNDEIMRIQDLQGKLKRKTQIYPKGIEFGKKDFEVELVNMRKIGADSYEDGPYMNFFSLQELFRRFSSIGITSDSYEFTERLFSEGNKIKLEFKDLKGGPYRTTGYYIVNSENYAIEEFVLTNNLVKPAYKKTRGVRYVTTNYSAHFFFTKKSNKTPKYYLSSGKIEADVEVIHDDDGEKYIYMYSNSLSTSDNFSAMNVKSNVKENKELFSIKYPYNSQYWNSQNQLLLTEEMQEFIKKMGKENTEFKVRSNMD